MPPAPARPLRAGRLPSGLRVTGFSGARYVDGRIVDLAAVTSPPYDVMDRADVLAHETREPHNIVRLVRPRSDACGQEGPYAHAARLLRDWLAEGVLRRDEGPGFYAYEQGDPGRPGWQRGVLAAVGLGGPAQSAVVPHEDVMLGPVEDRTELMDRTGANLEPILLLHEGAADAGEEVERVLAATCASPATATSYDRLGRRHRLWLVPGQEQARLLGDALAERGALIADGHHRWAAYHVLQHRRRAAGAGAGPWDAGLALLVDPVRYPLHLGAIHRAVEGLDVAWALARTDHELVVARRVPDGPQTRDALRGPGSGAPGGGLLLVPGDRRPGESEVSGVHLTPGPALAQRLAEVLPAHSEAYRSLPATLLHSVLLPLWDVPEQRVSYHHEADAARRSAAASSGAAVLLPPTSLESVLDVVAAGETMPRKSTSFGPKPASGLVLRLLGSGVTERSGAAGAAPR